MLSLIAAHRGFETLALDLLSLDVPYLHPKLRVVKGNVLGTSLSESSFDLVLNCSTVEHVGLAGRYDVTESRPDGDLEAMERIRRLLKPSGIMLMTVPVGRDAIFGSVCSV